MPGFGWAYPPGVTGREPAISGEYPCVNCGATLPEEAECPNCDATMEWDDKAERWTCPCGESCSGEYCPGGCDEPDPDEAYDRRWDR